MDGLRFHFGKLEQYTNPTGGGLDKIPQNTKAQTEAYFRQFAWTDRHKGTPHPFSDAAAPWYTPTKPANRLFLRKKAQYQAANHLLGIGQKAYWTGSISKTTLLGLDIDYHESQIAEEVSINSELALELFVEMTGLFPVACESPGGINAFLICDKPPLTTAATNEIWHEIIRIVNAEAGRRGLFAKLECKGKARIFDDQTSYCGVQFKDPFWAMNPTDDELHCFWETLEAEAVTGNQLHDLLTTLVNDKVVSSPPTNSSKNKTPIVHSDQDELLETYRGNWVQQCRNWAINGLPCDDSIEKVISELSKWLFYVELADEVDEQYRLEQVIKTLTEFCILKNNKFITRLNCGKVEDVKVLRNSSNGVVAIVC